MSYNIPIIVIHNGSQEYLDVCLKQAHFSNPNSRIILIGRDNQKTLPFVEYYDIGDYNEEAEKFTKIYRHFSCNSYEIERLCFERWFVINEFVNKNNIEYFLHLDSDVLLFSDFSKEDEYMEEMRKHDITYCGNSAHTSFFTSNALQKFCDFITEIFEDDEFFEQFEKNPEENNIIYNKNPELRYPKPLSDMTALQIFVNSGRVKSLNVNCVIKDCIINNNLKYSNSFPDKPVYPVIGEILNVIYNKDNRPILYNIQTQKFVRMLSIHFQGPNTKFLMSKYCTYDKKNVNTHIQYTEKDIEFMFNINMVEYGFKKKFVKIAYNLLCLFVTSKQARTKLRAKILGSKY